MKTKLAFVFRSSQNKSLVTQIAGMEKQIPPVAVVEKQFAEDCDVRQTLISALKG